MFFHKQYKLPEEEAAMKVDHGWREKLYSSLRFKAEVLREILKHQTLIGSELGTFLQTAIFEVKVCNALSWSVLGHVSIETEGIKDNLRDFLAKAEKFKNEKERYSAWWPDREGIIAQAYRNLFSGSSNGSFALLVATVMEALEAIEIWEKNQE